jgi:hypothetical protein
VWPLLANLGRFMIGARVHHSIKACQQFSKIERVSRRCLEARRAEPIPCIWKPGSNDLAGGRPAQRRHREPLSVGVMAKLDHRLPQLGLVGARSHNYHNREALDAICQKGNESDRRRVYPAAVVNHDRYRRQLGEIRC